MAAERSRPPARLEVASRSEWRRWLRRHHASESGIWLVFRKGPAGADGIDYEAAVEEALCYGWIDSLVKRLDDERYARKFTPRNPDSRWSTANRRRYADLEARGLLAAPGRAKRPTDRDGDAPRPSLASLPADFERRLRASPRAWRFFRDLAPSYRRAYVAWIGAARRPETRERRIRESLELLAAGRKLGLK